MLALDITGNPQIGFDLRAGIAAGAIIGILIGLFRLLGGAGRRMESVNNGISSALLLAAAAGPGGHRFLLRRARPAPRPAQRAPAPQRTAQPAPVESAPQPAAGQQWAPPAYSAASSTIAGPSLRIGIGFMRIHEGNLLVSWNALNDGSEPLAVHRGRRRYSLQAAMRWC